MMYGEKAQNLSLKNTATIVGDINCLKLKDQSYNQRPMIKNIKTADPCVMIIFGATGDLTKRKLFPALYNLAKDDFLPHKFSIIGVGRQELTSEEFRGQIIANLKEFIPKGVDDRLMRWFEDRIYYTGGDFNDDKRLFGDLKELLGEVTAAHQIPDNYFFY